MWENTILQGSVRKIFSCNVEKIWFSSDPNNLAEHRLTYNNNRSVTKKT